MIHKWTISALGFATCLVIACGCSRSDRPEAGAPPERPPQKTAMDQLGPRDEPKTSAVAPEPDPRGLNGKEAEADFVELAQLRAKQKAILDKVNQTGNRDAIAAANWQASMEIMKLHEQRRKVVSEIQFEVERLEMAAPACKPLVAEFEWLHRDRRVSTESLEYCLKSLQFVREALASGRLELAEGVTAADTEFWAAGILFLVGEESPTRKSMYFVIDSFNDVPTKIRERADRVAIRRYLDAYNQGLRACLERRASELGIGASDFSVRELRLNIDKHLGKNEPAREKLFQDCRDAARKAFVESLRKGIESGDDTVERLTKLLRLGPSAPEPPTELLHALATYGTDASVVGDKKNSGAQLSILAQLAQRRLDDIRNRSVIGPGTSFDEERPTKPPSEGRKKP